MDRAFEEHSQPQERAAQRRTDSAEQAGPIGRLSPAAAMSLQRAAGNRAVSQLVVQRQDGDGGDSSVATSQGSAGSTPMTTNSSYKVSGTHKGTIKLGDGPEQPAELVFRVSDSFINT
jgi:hypothetical protein